MNGRYVYCCYTVRIYDIMFRKFFNVIYIYVYYILEIRGLISKFSIVWNTFTRYHAKPRDMGHTRIIIFCPTRPKYSMNIRWITDAYPYPPIYTLAFGTQYCYVNCAWIKMKRMATESVQRCISLTKCWIQRIM